jgi:hypothetical protein
MSAVPPHCSAFGWQDARVNSIFHRKHYRGACLCTQDDISHNEVIFRECAEEIPLVHLGCNVAEATRLTGPEEWQPPGFDIV